MRIIKNQSFLEHQSNTYIRSELSNVAAVISSPQVMVRYYQIDVNASTTLTGLHNTEDFIGPQSTVQYDVIENLPMAGIDNLVSQASFDDELGFEEDFSSSGIILPNTIVPKPNEFFQVIGSEVTALYVVTTKNPVVVRSNPFVEIQFRLYSRDPELIKQLERQVHDIYRVTVTAIGLDKNLLIKKSSMFDVEHHVNQYLDIVDLYKTYFYDEQKSAFVFDGLPGIDGGGCPGYVTSNDILDGTDGGWREEFGDPQNPHYAMVQDVETLQNGVTINERGDRFYVVDGEPIVVPGYVPYWMVRNHTDRMSNTKRYDSDCCCMKCVNKTCINCHADSEWNQLLQSEDAQGNIIVRQVFIDMTLWKMMFDEGIVIYDDVVTYANNNYRKTVPRIYTDCPNIYIDEHLYKRSVLYRIMNRVTRNDPFEFIHPFRSEADPRIAKFQGKNLYYLEHYDRHRCCSLNIGYYNIWDDEFQWRIKNCKPYPLDDVTVGVTGCDSCCTAKPIQYYYPFNRHLRNAIIFGYNNKQIDWEALEIIGERSIENYTLLPIVLHYYKEYIESLQK